MTARCLDGPAPTALALQRLGEVPGISLYGGCCCAHAYLRHRLGMPEGAAAEPARGGHGEPPGAVRVSFGLHNIRDELLRLADALGEIARGRHQSGDRYDVEQGEFVCPDLRCDYADYFSR